MSLARQASSRPENSRATRNENHRSLHRPRSSSSTCFSRSVLSLVLVVGNIFRKLLPLLVNHDVPLEYLSCFIAYVLPFSLIFTIPWGLLTAVLLVFGRLSADNELTALRSNGVSIARICVPLVGDRVGLHGRSRIWLNVEVAPAAQEQMRSTVFDLATHNPMAFFGSDQVIDQFPGRKIYVGKKDGNKLENILVFEMDEQSMPMKVTHAREGAWRPICPIKRILMHLYNARYSAARQADPYDLRRMRDGISVAEGTLPISLEELYEKEKRRAESVRAVARAATRSTEGRGSEECAAPAARRSANVFPSRSLASPSR